MITMFRYFVAALTSIAVWCSHDVVFAEDCAPNINTDCNANGVADSCDISQLTSPDCNQSGIPDECELGTSLLVIGPFGIKFVRTNDCNLSGVPDDCKSDCNNSSTPDVCKDDLNNDQVADACAEKSQCQGQCEQSTSTVVRFDEDQDGASNCQELQDQTEPCDAGSFVPRLAPAACGGPNGFFQQVNIATVINQLSRSLSVRAEYRNSSGATLGTMTFSLPANVKKDLIVNDMGLVPNSYGTLCIFTDATTMGAWSGGITTYKRRKSTNPGFGGDEVFDYALYYPFANPLRGPITIPLNTNTIGTDGRGTVANWIRITDAAAGQAQLVTGTLSYFNAQGSLVGSDAVAIPNGGRLDFGAHAHLGPGAVGLAQFAPASNGVDYYLEVTRYFYEGVGASSDKFYTAFPLPVGKPTGAAVTGKASARPNELSIFEFVNADENKSDVKLKVFGASGSVLLDEAFSIPPKGTIHRVITNELRAASNPPVSAIVEASRDSLDSTTLVYGFDSDGKLLYGYAPQFGETAGNKQFTEFNSFINHESFIETINTTDSTILADVSVIGLDQNPIPSAGFSMELGPHATDRRQLLLPKNTYGSLVIDSAGALGLVVRNDVVRQGQYVLPFFGR